MPYEWKIAMRFLTDGKAQTFFILLGIAVGVAVQIFLNSIITGVQENLLDNTIGTSSHITVLSSDSDSRNRIGEYTKVLERLDIDPDIITASASVDGNAFLKRAEKDTSLIVKGIELERADSIYQIKDRMVSGNAQISANQVLIGKDLASEYDIESGEAINLTLAGGSIQSFIVGGIFDLESAGINGSWIFMDITRAQKLYNLSGYASRIEMQITTPFEADIKAQQLGRAFPDLKVENWKGQNAQLLSALSSQSSSSYTIQVFVLIAIALGISSVLAVSVVQKSKQIGILKAMGVTGKSASKIFIIQGTLLGFAGAVAGIGLGALLLEAFRIGTSGGGGLGFALTIKPVNIIIVLAVATFAGMAASFVPARNSEKLNPMEVIRNG
ncbi:ABC transporter permease [Proteocatella sphenisci]|uniref:ABC transporter permease n=1 Tax=Proteocatella sphenisci TaxID=181070 RepID=UPI00048F41DC|nr:FtsX-like permease family protein [Proteocatella sphenisci]